MGKYIKKFDTHLDYEDFIETEDFIKPNVSYCVDNKDVHYNSIQTLFALEILSGEFISFYFQSGTLYANTDDGSSALWVLDSNGVVVDNISYSIADRASILERINEHYGTSFTGWSDNEIGLRQGDTLPNWNAYEKIEMPEPFLWKMLLQGTPVSVFGKVENNILICYAQAVESALVVDESASIVGSNHVDDNYFESFVKPKLDVLGITYTSIAYDTSTYRINDNVENWNEYTLLQ